MTDIPTTINPLSEDELTQLAQALDQLEPHEYPEAAQLAVQRLTDDQLLDHRLWCGDVEPKRRETEKAKAEAQAEIIQQVWETTPELKPAFADTPGKPNDMPAWKQPTGAHDSYPPNAIVQHAGVVWQNIAGKLNSWEPGNDGPLPTWMQITPSDTETPAGPAVWVQPTGAHDTYPKGAQVTFEGGVYESLIDANTYSPVDYPAGWRAL